jgi:hypothetical protein
MGRHLALPLITIPSPFPLLMVRTSHPREQPERKDAIRIGTPLPAAPTPLQLSGERKRSIANARRKFALVAVHCSLTADMRPDETVQRDQELDLHRLRQTEYRVRFRLRLRHSDPRLAYRAFPTTPCRSTFPENLRLLLPRFRIDRNRQRRSHETGYPDLTHNL